MLKVNTARIAIQTETDRLVQEYLKNGGIIKVCPTRRAANSYSWPASRQRSSVANRGRKSNTLRNQGLSKANGR